MGYCGFAGPEAGGGGFESSEEKRVRMRMRMRLMCGGMKVCEMYWGVLNRLG